MAEDDRTLGLCPHPCHGLVNDKGKEGGQSSCDPSMLSDAIGKTGVEEGQEVHLVACEGGTSIEGSWRT